MLNSNKYGKCNFALTSNKSSCDREIQTLERTVERPCCGEAAREGRDAAREGRDAAREGRDAAREGRDAAREGRDEAREGRDAAREGRGCSARWRE